MRRFFITFGLLALTAYVLATVPLVQQHVMVYVNQSISYLAGSIVHAFGGEVVVRGEVLVVPGFAMRIVDMCNGVEATLLLWAALLAYPAAWSYKLKGLLIGFLAVHLVNILRVISLLYLGVYDDDWFDRAHRYVWDVIMIIDILLVFLAWLWLMPARRTDEATA